MVNQKIQKCENHDASKLYSLLQSADARFSDQGSVPLRRGVADPNDHHTKESIRYSGRPDRKRDENGTAIAEVSSSKVGMRKKLLSTVFSSAANSVIAKLLKISLQNARNVIDNCA